MSSFSFYCFQLPNCLSLKPSRKQKWKSLLLLELKLCRLGWKKEIPQFYNAIYWIYGGKSHRLIFGLAILCSWGYCKLLSFKKRKPTVWQQHASTIQIEILFQKRNMLTNFKRPLTGCAGRLKKIFHLLESWWPRTETSNTSDLWQWKTSGVLWKV